MNRAKIRLMHRTSLAAAAIGALAAFVSAASAQGAPPGNKPDVTLGSTPDTVVWGYISARTPPVLRIKSGTTVRIDTLSHQGLTTNADPVTYSVECATDNHRQSCSEGQRAAHLNR